MAAIVVVLPTPLRRLAGGAREVTAEGADIAAVLASLRRAHPEVAGRVLDEGGKPRRGVNLFLNGVDVRILQRLDTPVADGDRLSLVLAIAGG